MHLRAFWLQEGVINHEAAAYVAEAGVGMVMNRCLWKECQRMNGPYTVSL